MDSSIIKHHHGHPLEFERERFKLFNHKSTIHGWEGCFEVKTIVFCQNAKAVESFSMTTRHKNIFPIKLPPVRNIALETDPCFIGVEQVNQTLLSQQLEFLEAFTLMFVD